MENTKINSSYTYRIMERVEDMEALTQISDNLRFLHTSLTNNDLPQVEKNALIEELDRLDQRRKDNHLYLAVVGEFNTGKTTFINALLHNNLLKSSRIPMTTAAATYVQYGEQLSLQYKSIERNSPFVTVDSDAASVSAARKLSAPSSVRTLLDLVREVTTNNHIAKELSEVHITYPAQSLANGIVIIDTPGSNVNNTDHQKVTEHIVSNVADTAIIIMSAQQALMSSLVGYLRNHLNDYLHRCIFVLTHFDQIDQANRETLMENVQSRLRQVFDFDPPVFPASAQALLDVLPDAQSSTVSLEERNYWANGFQNLEQRIGEILAIQRTTTIAENILRLLDLVFKHLETALVSQQSQYQKSQQLLEATLQDMDSFTQEQRRVTSEKLRTANSLLHSATDNAVRNTSWYSKRKIKDAIYDATTYLAIDNFIKNDIRDTIQGDMESLRDEINDEFQRYDSRVAQIQKEFEIEFYEKYKNLELLKDIKWDKKDVTDTSGVPFSEVEDTALSIYKKLEGQMQGGMGVGLVGGAIAGAAIGSIVPVFGTVVGGLIGGVVGFFGGGLFGLGSLSDYKDKIWQAIQPTINDCFSSADISFSSHISRLERNAREYTDKYINQYSDRYRNVVSLIRQQQAMDRKKLDALEMSTMATLNQLHDRQVNVTKKLDELRGQLYA